MKPERAPPDPPTRKLLIKHPPHPLVGPRLEGWLLPVEGGFQHVWPDELGVLIPQKPRLEALYRVDGRSHGPAIIGASHTAIPSPHRLSVHHVRHPHPPRIPTAHTTVEPELPRKESPMLPSGWHPHTARTYST